MDRLRVGLLGVRDGLKYLRACRDRDDVQLAGVCDRDIESLSEVAGRFEVPRAVTDDERLFSHCQLDAVIVATPDRMRRRHVAAAIDAGLHVFVAPPLAQTVNECASVRAAALRRPGQVVMVGHELRFVPFLQAARSLCQSGKLGSVYAVRLVQHANAAEWTDRDNWRADERTGSPPFLSLGADSVDFARALVGELDTVQAEALHRAMLKLPFEDTVSARYEAGNTLVEIFFTLGARRPPAVSLEVLGTEGCLQGTVGGRNNAYWSTVRSELQRHDLPGQPTASGARSAVAEWLDAIHAARAPEITVDDGLHNVAGALAALRSHHEGGRRVAVFATEADVAQAGA